MKTGRTRTKRAPSLTCYDLYSAYADVLTRKTKMRLIDFVGPDKGWKPRWNKRVGTYCSPRCGAGCTRAAWREAFQAGKALAEKMGTGWKWVVWENLGWHYKAVKGVVEIYPNIRHKNHQLKIIGYTCFINSAHQYIGDGKSASLALARALLGATRATDKIMSDIGAAGNG